MRLRLDGFTWFMAVVLVLIAFRIALVHELNQPLEVLLPRFDVVNVTPAPLVDLAELGIR